MLPGRLQLDPRPLGKRLHLEVGEHLVCDPQLFARVQATTLAAEPLAVKEVRTGTIDRDARAAESLDRLGVEVIGALVIDQQCVRASRDSQSPISPARPAPLAQTAVGLNR